MKGLIGALVALLLLPGIGVGATLLGDLDNDGDVDFDDFFVFAQNFGKKGGDVSTQSSGDYLVKSVILDPALLSIIRERINKPMGDILLSEVAGMTSLQYNLPPPDKQVKRLDGIEVFKSLKNFGLHGCLISDISPIAKLDSLETLGLHDNQISDISPLAKSKTLKAITLSQNLISNIVALSDLPTLDRVYLRYNEITDLSPLAKNKALGKDDVVDVRNNPLSGTTKANDVQALLERGVTVYYDR